jgi:hypothetical protein
MAITAHDERAYSHRRTATSAIVLHTLMTPAIIVSALLVAAAVAGWLIVALALVGLVFGAGARIIGLGGKGILNRQRHTTPP